MSDTLDSRSMPISFLQWLLCHLIDSLLSGLIEWMTLTLPKGRRRVWNITTSDSRKRRRIRRDSITKALKCFLLSVLFQFSFLGFLCPSFAQRFVFSFPLQRLHSLHSLCFGSDILPVCVLGIQSEEAASHLQKSQLVTNLPMFVFHKMLKEGTKPADCPLMVLTKYIDNSNHWKTVNGKKVERFMETNEFVAGVSYTCMIVITNVSPI